MLKMLTSRPDGRSAEGRGSLERLSALEWLSDEEKLKLASDSAKRNLLESLNIAAESNSDE